jgi:hypothetical protein
LPRVVPSGLFRTGPALAATVRQLQGRRGEFSFRHGSCHGPPTRCSRSMSDIPRAELPRCRFPVAHRPPDAISSMRDRSSGTWPAAKNPRTLHPAQRPLLPEPGARPIQRHGSRLLSPAGHQPYTRTPHDQTDCCRRWGPERREQLRRRFAYGPFPMITRGSAWHQPYRSRRLSSEATLATHRSDRDMPAN